MLELKCGQSLDSAKNVNLSSLPPPRVCLNEHMRRVNYQLAIWKRAHCSKPDVPHAPADHRSTMNDGKLQPCWFNGAVLPKSTTDILGAIDKDEMADGDSTDDDYESDSNADDDDSDSD